MKRIFQDWLLSSFLTFLLYELLWRLLSFYFFPFESWTELCFDFLYCALFTLSSIVISRLLGKVGFFARLTTSRQILFCMITLVLNLGLAFVFEKIFDTFSPDPGSEFFWHSFYMFCVIATLLTLVHTTYHYCMMVIRQKDELTALQKQALKNQLAPHFVFNSLSVLAELTRQNPPQAEAYVIKLSRVYRYILSHIEKDYASIAETMRFITDYVALQELRVQGRIDLSIEGVTGGDNEGLIPMSVQLLVENAIKHNTPDEHETLYIRITRQADELVVKNSVKKLVSVSPSLGIGLESLRQQYRLEGLPMPVVNSIDGWFEVRLPLIKRKG